MTIVPAKASLATTALTLAALAAPAAHAADVFTLESTTFNDGQLLPKAVGDIPARGPNCKGENLSPQFSWTSAPEGTKSFAFTVLDVDGAIGAGFPHWVAYGIAPDATSFAEGKSASRATNMSAGLAARSSSSSLVLARRSVRRTITSFR